MKSTDLIASIDKILIHHLECAQEQLVDHALLVNDLGADSLSLVEITMSIEDELKVEIDDSMLEKIMTYGDMVSLAVSLTSKD